jgi:molybdopterin synthase catalytic subunit
MARFLVTAEPLSVEGVLRLVAAAHADETADTAAEGPGAVSLFVGLVRNRHAGRTVEHLTYEAFEPLALTSFRQIADEVQARLPGTVVGIHHRTGTLAVGESSVVIAAAAAHRADACAASRYAIERVKQIAPIWKHEVFAGGSSWVEGATARPDAEDAREQAWRRACP